MTKIKFFYKDITKPRLPPNIFPSECLDNETLKKQVEADLLAKEGGTTQPFCFKENECYFNAFGCYRNLCRPRIIPSFSKKHLKNSLTKSLDEMRSGFVHRAELPPIASTESTLVAPFKNGIVISDLTGEYLDEFLKYKFKCLLDRFLESKDLRYKIVEM